MDNEGNVIFLNEKHDLMMINSLQVQDTFYKNIHKGKESVEDILTLKFGQGTAVAQVKEKIYWMRYTQDGFSKSKLIGHKVLLSKENKLAHIVMPVCPDSIILIYKLSQVITIVVWDVVRDIEHTHFMAREGDALTDYLPSTSKILGKGIDSDNKEVGFVCFIKHTNQEESSFNDLDSLDPASDQISHYMVDLNTGVPNPFIKAASITPEWKWCQGTRIRRKGDLILNGGNLITSSSYQDIWYFQQKMDRKLEMYEFKKIVSLSTLYLELLYQQKVYCF